MLSFVVLVLGASVLLLGSGTGTSAGSVSVATAQAFGIRIVVPGQAAVTGGYVSAPTDSSGFQAGFTYPADASILTSGAITLDASAVTPSTALASASAEITGISLFGGEVTIERVTAKVSARADERGGSGDFTGTEVVGIGGSAVSGTALGDWGTITTSTGVGAADEGPDWEGWHGSVAALDIKLTAAHGPLPAGSEIIVGYASTNVRADNVEATTTEESEPDPSQEPTNVTKGAVQRSATKREHAAPVERKTHRRKPIGKIPTVQPKLTAGRYVFPVYGAVSYGDTFGAPRADVSWHHGADIFADLGAPILAVADGTVFSVGWNDIGGWRFWLRDRKGNEFYYAHLSAFSPFAKNKAQVRAGTVLGFVGNTGDAAGTPYHLHFEVHPVSLLALGYDGAVNPTRYLDGWRRLQDVSFSTTGAWLPGLLHLTPSRAPVPGAVLLRISDISSASGLDPGSLRRALGPTGRADDNLLAGAVGPQAPKGPRDLGRG